MSKVLTPELALELLEKAVKKRGEDYIYQKSPAGSCFYSTMDHKPSCGVGFVFYEFSHEFFENISEYEYKRAGSIGVPAFLSSIYARDLVPESVELSSEAVAILADFQSRQDNGETWGSSLSYAREWAIRRGYITEYWQHHGNRK